ncbi:DsbA family oxidoreductase [Paeniglutamicibacter cryotolerans]|uniref:Putative DsbA family dithiol-disulfide isomerase n=1 Tax=Paeniglutamicibacter cryotolerans TaxID=670079 RepID=A0A839QHH6_9MICC|nr:DsbA family oxidoreductase [Paeniglutamicibacter cryotolerans]MBB2995207.1 putative DsbA family dithiol-disulfide isomerase [Paeniglutamicibacter cryotolerans]
MSETRLNIDIWSDIACPWCYIGKRRFETALNALPFAEKVDVTWHSYQLDPTLPENYAGSELDYLTKAKGMDPAQLQQMLGHVTEQAAAVGLRYDFDGLKVANSFNAHRLLHLAKAHGKGEQVKEALLAAHFVKGLNTGDAATLTEIGVAAGLPGDEVEAVLSSDQYADAVRADIEQARAMGISGVPFFVLEGKYGISGAQPVEVFEQAMTQVWEEIGGTTLQMMAPASADGAACGPEGCN